MPALLLNLTQQSQAIKLSFHDKLRVNTKAGYGCSLQTGERLVLSLMENPEMTSSKML